MVETITPKTDDKKYLEDIKKKFPFSAIERDLDKLKGLKILIIGDIIIDIYTFVRPKGRAIKDPILSTGFQQQEEYLGGILAIGNHLSSYNGKVNIVSLIGDKHTYLDFIQKSINKNIGLKTFVKKNSFTNVKKRYIDYYRNNKLFKIEYVTDEPISEALTEEIISYLSEEIKKYDLVVVGDFGHGFLNQPLRKFLEGNSKFLSVNVQSNSSNMGYNYINHYKRPNFIIMNEEELRLPLMIKFEDLDHVMEEFNKKFRYNRFLVTLGKQGCAFFSHGKIYKSPVFTDNVVDTVGAGDAAFALLSLLSYLDLDDELLPFMANCAGAIKSEYMGNKESVTKEKLLNFIKRLYENELE